MKAWQILLAVVVVVGGALAIAYWTQDDMGPQEAVAPQGSETAPAVPPDGGPESGARPPSGERAAPPSSMGAEPPPPPSAEPDTTPPSGQRADRPVVPAGTAILAG